MIVSVLLAIELTLSSALPAMASFLSPPKIPSPSSMLSDMEKRYHIDTESLQNQGETLNVADNKKPAPEVTLFFNPTDPKEGEKITARAFPMYFSNNEQDLYYGWFLKHKGCDLNNKPSVDVKGLCDRNSDSKITVEDWKIEAMKLIAQNGFDVAEADYDSDTDADGYKARFGGNNKPNMPDHCYVNDAATGKNYELGDASDISFTCPDGTSPVCVVEDQEIGEGTGSDVWTSKTATPASIGAGGSLINVGGTLYAFRGGSTTDFYSYSGSDNTWTELADAPAAIGTGGALVYPDAGDDIYALGGGTNFYKYSIANDAWTDLTTADPVPGAIGAGASLVYNADTIYALRGDATTDFYSYSLTTGNWNAPLTSITAAVGAGGSLVYPETGDYIYALRGGSTAAFYRYSITGNSWSALTGTGLVLIGAGGALAYPGSGDYIYALRGSSTKKFLRYSITGDTWAVMADTSDTVATGGALAYPGSGDYLYALRGGSTTDFYRYTISGAASIETGASGTCSLASLPSCSDAGLPTCANGLPRCVADPASSTSCGTVLSACTSGDGGGATTYCKHLFPNWDGFTSGDGSFGKGEEQKWGTNPADPDTADNGNKDEANVVGLGRSSLTWNYVTGDQVGVAIEGTSMIGTKYNDSSSMIMWALSKKDCPISLADGTGSFFQSIKGYDVEMIVADMDINKCLSRNLVDPTQGGQATNLDVSLSATPESPLNDESGDGSGDMVSVQASISNSARNMSEVLYEWKVEMADSIQSLIEGGPHTANVTTDFQKMGLLGNTKGIALDTVRLKLDLKNDASMTFNEKQLDQYLKNGIGYLRFSTQASESFSSGVLRKGKSDIIVKFTSSGKKISVYRVGTQLDGSRMKVTLPPAPYTTGGICQGTTAEPLDRTVCRVIKNEIIGLRIDPTGLSNFKWTINGAPLTCTAAAVSPNCLDASGNEANFFPVSGDVGDTYTVTVTANDVATKKGDPNTEKVVTISRTFHVVAPTLSIKSVDTNAAWPKLLGQYKDVAGTTSVACPDGLCNEYSESIFEGFSDGPLGFQAVFLPNFLSATSTRQWTVDDTFLNESTPGAIAFSALKKAPDVYNLSLSASVVQSQEVRRALRDIWGISPLDSPEIHFATTAQVELLEPGFAQGTLQGSKKYLAAIASYIPASVMFSFRIVLSIVLILFTANILLTLLPEQSRFPGTAFRKRGE